MLELKIEVCLFLLFSIFEELKLCFNDWEYSNKKFKGLLKLVKVCKNRLILEVYEQLRSVFRTHSNIYDEAFYENNLWLETVYYFRKNAPSKMFDWVLNAPLF